MNKTIPFFSICILVLAACVTAALPPSSIPPSTAIPTVTVLIPDTGLQAASTPTATPKPKGKKTQTSATREKDRDASVAPTAQNSSFIADVIAGRPTDGSVTLNVVLQNSMTIYYDCGTASGQYSNRTESQQAAAGVPVETILNGLQPDTRYYYRLHYGNDTGQEHTFVTQRKAGSSFVFDIQGDSHPERVGKQFDADLYTKTLLSAAADHPDFYFTIGDDFSVDSLKTVNADTVKALYIHQRQWLGLVDAPVFLVNGNHEQASLANLDGTANNVAVWAQTSRNSYFPQPAPDSFYSGDKQPVDSIGLLRDYYAFTWGDALLVVIDPYWHSSETVDNQFGAGHSPKDKRDVWNVTLGDDQYQWFKQTLETSKSKYKFVFTHHVNGTGRGGIEVAGGGEWGDSKNLSAHRPGWTKTIQQLMADNHVTIFFQGHDHLFAHQELDGVIYQTLPEPANPFYTTENADAYQSGDKFPNSGHVRVTVSDAKVKVDYIRSYLEQPDETAFTYSVK